MTAQHIEISGEPMVLLSRAEFSRLAEAAEHYGDIVAAVDAQKRKEAGEEYIPADVVAKLVSGENPLRVWRKHRGLTLQQLGERVGRQLACISKLEQGHTKGDVTLWRALADALNVGLDDLIPPAPQ